MILLDASALYLLVKAARGRWPGLAERLLEEDTSLLDLTIYEALNAALIEHRRGLVSSPLEVARALAVIASTLRLLRVEPGHAEEIAKLAQQLRLTVYDAAYVYQARLHGARLVTSDSEILRRAPDVAVETRQWLRSSGLGPS